MPISQTTRWPVTQREYAALARLRLVSPRLSASRFPGPRLGPTPGASREFVDYRPYHPGDDVRAIDWQLYARLRKPFVRVFHAEADRPVHLLLDISNSMRFGTPDKLSQAKTVAAALSLVGLSDGDRVGLAIFSDRLHQVAPPRRGKSQLRHLQALFDRTEPSGVSDFNRAFTEYSTQMTPPGLLIVLSDFFAAEGYQAGLQALLGHKFEPVLIQVLAASELYPPGAGKVVLRDLEHGTSRPLSLDEQTRRQYGMNLQQAMTSLADFCRCYRLPYAQTLTSHSFAEVIYRLLQAGVWQRKCTS